MAKKVVAMVKLQLQAGKATPSPPVGPALGQHGVNIGDFVRQFNERTREANGTTIPVEITIYADRSFDFITAACVYHHLGPVERLASPRGPGDST